MSQPPSSEGTYEAHRPPTNERFVDIHCHCLSGMDDGPQTMQASLALCQSLVEDGVDTVIATPHQLGRYAGTNHSSAVRDAVSGLQTQLHERNIPLRVLPGGDVRLEIDIPRFLDSDVILTLADGGKYLLLELPHDVIVDFSLMIRSLSGSGRQVILSHPERNDVLCRQPELADGWVRLGMAVQVTAGALLGECGRRSQDAAWRWVDGGGHVLVASDAHDAHRRPPRMRAAYDAIRSRNGDAAARGACIENPSRVAAGNELTILPRCPSS